MTLKPDKFIKHGIHIRMPDGNKLAYNIQGFSNPWHLGWDSFMAFAWMNEWNCRV